MGRCCAVAGAVMPMLQVCLQRLTDSARVDGCACQVQAVHAAACAELLTVQRNRRLQQATGRRLAAQEHCCL